MIINVNLVIKYFILMHVIMLSFHAILSYNLKMYYFRDSYTFLKNIFLSRLFPYIFEIIIGF